MVFSRVIDQKSYRELEEIYRISSSTLRKRYERAKKKLSGALQETDSYYKQLGEIKMKYDYDERTIKNALNSIQTPEYDIVSEVEKRIRKRARHGALKGMFLSDWRFVFVLYSQSGQWRQQFRVLKISYR